MDMTPIQMERMGELYGYSRARASFLGGWKRRATDRLYGEAAHLFAWSDWVANSLKRDYRLPDHKVSTVPPGVDVSRFSPEGGAKPEDGVVRLLFVGGDFQRKGGDLLLRWARETQVQTQWELNIVTRDAQTDLPRNVHIHHGIENNSPELLRLYRQSDIFVLPTRADCFSLVAIEAMASGLPVVISNLGGIPEIVTDDETGYLIPPDDYGTLANRLDHLVRVPHVRARMGHAARSHAVTRFDARHNVGRILNRMRQEGYA
jgi:glycosyltransferase involved in cell wall biosynthesis